MGTLELPLLTDLITILAGDREIDGEMIAFDVLPSEAARVALLRKLLRLPASDVQKSVTVKLQEQMQLAVSKAQHADTKLSVSFCNLKEEERQESPPPLVELGVGKDRFGELKFDDIGTFIKDASPAGKARL